MTYPAFFRSRKTVWLLVLFAAFLCLALPAIAQGDPAADVTARCALSPASGKKTFSRCTDRNYRTRWQSDGGKSAALEVTAPKGETLSCVQLQWYERPHAWGVQLPDGDGWADWAHTEGSFLAETLILPEGTTRFRIVNAPGNTRRFALDEIRVYGAGEMPREVQRWEAPAEKADLMMVVAHPDDEVLWFGGALPTYAGERELACQVCMMVPTMPYRRLELLDALWTCGVRNYPVWSNFPDSFSGSLSKQYQRWPKDRVWRQVTEWIRRFRPDVLLTHDVNGEYGHGGHRVCADAVTHCLALAANVKKYPDSAKAYGTWDVPKCYLHLYPEGAVQMDWGQPLAAFGGQTGMEVAKEAFECHISQRNTRYEVEDFGPCDCRLFGLYRSLVGEDILKDDFFENIQ